MRLKYDIVLTEVCLMCESKFQMKRKTLKMLPVNDSLKRMKK